MTDELPQEQNLGGAVEEEASAGAQSQSQRISINAAQSGEWMPADEFQQAALAVVQNNSDVTLNLANLEHLDASALQILLALDREQRSREREFEVTHLSPSLRQWFGYAGAEDLLNPEAG